MKPLDSMEIRLCKMQAKLFEESVSKTDYSSAIFIRRFMLSTVAKSFDNKTFLIQTISLDEVLELLDQEFGDSSYGRIKFSREVMFWIGYIYRCLAIRYNLSSKVIYHLFNTKEILKYYNIGHTFDIVDMAERMMENINYKETSNQEKSYQAMKRLIYEEKIKVLLGKDVTVYIEPPKIKGISHSFNQGYIKDIKSIDGKYQDAYIIDDDKAINKYQGKVIAIIKNKDDDTNKLIVGNVNREYSDQDIKHFLSLKEKDCKYTIVK